MLTRAQIEQSARVYGLDVRYVPKHRFLFFRTGETAILSFQAVDVLSLSEAKKREMEPEEFSNFLAETVYAVRNWALRFRKRTEGEFLRCPGCGYYQSENAECVAYGQSHCFVEVDAHGFPKEAE